MPVYLSPVADTTWGTRITRVSNVANRRHGYARTPGWNADGSKILLAFSSPAAILDGRTYAQLYTLSSMVGYAHWSNTNPNRIFGTFNNDNRFYAENATTGAQTVLHTFSGYTEVSLGDGEGGIDDNDRYVALMTRTSAGANGLLVYDIGTDTVVSSLNFGATRPDNAQISRKGNYVVLTWGDGTGLHQGLERYNRALTSRINLSPYGRHGDNALDAAGNEIFVACSPNVDAFSLATGAATRLLASSAFEYGHVSGRNIDRPGWVYLSAYDWGATAGRPGRDQLVAVKTDGSRTVEVFGFANHRSTTYNSQPQATVSRDGTRVLFASEWGASNVYAFIAQR